MSDRKSPLQLQIELNDLMGQRVDINEQWLKKLTESFKEASRLIAVLNTRVEELEKKIG